MQIEGCEVPDGLRIDVENGLWSRAETDGSITLGFLAPFLAFAGRLTAVTYRAGDGPYRAGGSVATVESTRLTVPFRIPVPGTVVARNPALGPRPRLAHDDPYGAGWVVRILPQGPAPIALPTTAESAEAIADQIRSRRVRCYAALPDLEVYEIGAECRAILARLDEELARRAVGEVVLLVVDDPTAPIEMERWSDRTGYPILERRTADGLLHFLVRKVADPRPRRRP